MYTYFTIDNADNWTNPIIGTIVVNVRGKWHMRESFVQYEISLSGGLVILKINYRLNYNTCEGKYLTSQIKYIEKYFYVDKIIYNFQTAFK